MWLDCPVLLSNESPHNGHECMLVTVSESKPVCKAGKNKTWFHLPTFYQILAFVDNGIW